MSSGPGTFLMSPLKVRGVAALASGAVELIWRVVPGGIFPPVWSDVTAMVIAMVLIFVIRNSSRMFI